MKVIHTRIIMIHTHQLQDFATCLSKRSDSTFKRAMLESAKLVDLASLCTSGKENGNILSVNSFFISPSTKLIVKMLHIFKTHKGGGTSYLQ